MVQFWCDTNFLGGPIPTEIGAMPNLASLSMSDSQWTGPVPVEFAQRGPDMDNIFLHDNDLSGSIPPEFSLFTGAQQLTFLGNPQMGGNLTTEICELTFANLDLFTAECAICETFEFYPTIQCCDNPCP
mmetsp:Transcript_19082/g.44557  ORF Transcript_19082/g.44557 Transcript_19082/m.44557 type:complete len:129 (+) Transcript_19082:218-604(+)